VQEKEIIGREKKAGKDMAIAAKQISEVAKRNGELEKQWAMVGWLGVGSEQLPSRKNL